MLRSLFSGVSGLRDRQLRMDAIGNGVTHVNSVAWSGGRTAFKDGFAQLLQGATRPPGDEGGTKSDACLASPANGGSTETPKR